VEKMKTPPVKIAASMPRKVGVATRRHWMGLASIALVTSVSRRPSSASGR